MHTTPEEDVFPASVYKNPLNLWRLFAFAASAVYPRIVWVSVLLCAAQLVEPFINIAKEVLSQRGKE